MFLCKYQSSFQLQCNNSFGVSLNHLLILTADVICFQEASCNHFQMHSMQFLGGKAFHNCLLQHLVARNKNKKFLIMVIRWFLVIRCLVGLRKHWFIFITVIAFNCTCGFVWFNCFIIDLRQSRGPSFVAWTRSQKSKIIPQSSSVFFSSVIFSKVRKGLLLETIRKFLKFRNMSLFWFEIKALCDYF